MADSFFGFNSEFPPGLTTLGRHGLEEELLTDNVEEEYDALNDETFGHAASDDWDEEGHDKLSALQKRKESSDRSVFGDSFFEGDESQNEIISKSISQLGLEDDLDDPAIMTIGRTQRVSSRLDSVFGPSPPPPAFLETEICGSPKTHSIWSTTPKDSGINSLLQSHSEQISSQGSTSPLTYGFDSAPFSTPIRSAWMAEELEKNFLSNSTNQTNKTSHSNWPSSESKPEPSYGSPPNQVLNQSFTSSSPFGAPGSNMSSFSTFGQTKPIPQVSSSDVIRSPESRLPFTPPKVSNFGPVVIPPHLRPNIMSPIGATGNNSIGGPIHSSPVSPFQHGRPRLVRAVGPGIKQPIVNGAFLPYPYGVNNRMNMMPNQVPLRPASMPNFPPGFNFHRMGLAPYAPQIRDLLLTGKINHPMLNHLRFPMTFHNKQYNGEQKYYQSNEDEDEYAGLMTQKEKEWLLRIQMMLLKTENPYAEDYYYTTQVARRCMKKFSESAINGGGDGPQVVLPEKSRQECKTFVPTQFAGSLGKLQAVSVNFPRKVLDITVARPLEDDEGKVVTNQSLMKYRKLLMDIEKLYSYLLEIDDEERRILALPIKAENIHHENVLKLTNKLYLGLACESISTDDSFQNIMSIRKGRLLAFRAFSVFNDNQKLQCLISILKCLPVVVKKDQNDLVLVQCCDTVVQVIRKLSLPDLVLLGEAFESNMSSEIYNKESGFSCALKNKFGSSVICTMFQQAEKLYSGYDLFEDDIQARWSKVVLQMVDCICSMTGSSISSPAVPCTALLCHFQRFAVDRNQFEVLKGKLQFLESDPKGGGESV